MKNYCLRPLQTAWYLVSHIDFINTSTVSKKLMMSYYIARKMFCYLDPYRYCFAYALSHTIHFQDLHLFPPEMQFISVQNYLIQECLIQECAKQNRIQISVLSSGKILSRLNQVQLCYVLEAYRIQNNIIGIYLEVF